MDTKPVALRTKLIIGVSLTALVIAAALLGLRAEMLTQLNETTARQQEAIEQLTRKLGGIEAQLATLAAVPHPDLAAFDTVQTTLATTQTNLTQLNDRLTALEKKPLMVATDAAKPASPALPSSTPVATGKSASFNALANVVRAGAPYQTELDHWLKEHPTFADKAALLRASAGSGLATDETLRSQLIATIDGLNKTDTNAETPTIVSRINTHLAGLVSIRKQPTTAPELVALRQISSTAPIDSLVVIITQLPAANQATFSPWLEKVRARNAALAEMNTLATLDTTP